MSFRRKSRPDHRWSPWSVAGTSAGRAPRFEMQAQVEGLESRNLLSSLHFLPGGEPTFNLSGDGRTVTVEFTIAGIGNKPVDASLTVNGTADVSVQNPGNGAHFPPGQQVPFILVTDDFVQTENKNGSVTFTATFTITDEAILDSLNVKPKWDGIVNSASITSASLSITQGNQELTGSATF
jgi:hypothetical protein